VLLSKYLTVPSRPAGAPAAVSGAAAMAAAAAALVPAPEEDPSVGKSPDPMHTEFPGSGDWRCG
jgi:hypothetical protein